MPEEITWKVSVSVQGGPRLPIGDTVTVDAYDVVDVDVVDGASNYEVEVQPGDAGSVHVFMVTAGQYGEDLTYRVNDASADPLNLDAPLVLVGSGAVKLLGAPPQKLLFSNALGQEVSVRVLVGRMAT